MLICWVIGNALTMSELRYLQAGRSRRVPMGLKTGLSLRNKKKRNERKGEREKDCSKEHEVIKNLQRDERHGKNTVQNQPNSEGEREGNRKGEEMRGRILEDRSATC